MTSFTAKGEVFIKTETTEVLQLPTEENRVSHNFEATRPEKNSTKCTLATAFSGSTHQNGGEAEDDANINYQFPTIVVHSAQESPRKSLATLSSKIGSKEARKFSAGEIIAENSSNSVFHEVSQCESIEPFSDSYEQNLSLQKVEEDKEVELGDKSPYVYEMDFANTSSDKTSFQEEHGQETLRYSAGARKGNKLLVTTTTLADSVGCTPGDADDDNDCKIKHGPGSICNETDTIRSTGNQCIGFENEVFLSKTSAEGSSSSPQSVLSTEIPLNTWSARDGSATSLVKEETMGHKRYVSQAISNGEMQEQKEKRKSSVPLTVSRLITSSASMFEENTDQPERGQPQLMKNSAELSFKFGSNLSLRALGKV